MDMRIRDVRLPQRDEMAVSAKVGEEARDWLATPADDELKFTFAPGPWRVVNRLYGEPIGTRLDRFRR